MATSQVPVGRINHVKAAARALIMRVQQGEQELIELSAGVATCPNELVYGTVE